MDYWKAEFLNFKNRQRLRFQFIKSPTKQSVFKLYLSSVDDSSRVGDITSGTSISSSDSGDGSRGSSKGGERSRGGNLGVAGSNWSNGSNRGHSGDGRGSVAKTGIAVSQTSVSQTSVSQTGVSQTGVSQSSVTKTGTVGTVEGISLSLPLGDMDNTSRVGDIASGTSVSSSDSGDGSRGKSSNVHGSRGGDTSVAGSNRGHSSDRSSIAVASISETSMSETSVAETSVAETGIAETSVAMTVGTVESIGISLSLPLGNMDNTSRVGDITSGTSVSSSDSRDGSRGKSSNVHGSRRRDTGVAGSIWGSVPCVAESSIASITGMASIAESSITSIAEPGVASTVAKEVGVSLSGGCRSKEESCLELKIRLVRKEKTKNYNLYQYSRGTCSCWTVKNFFRTLPTVVSAVVIAGCVPLSFLYQDRHGCKNWFLHNARLQDT